jgi:hypothetical protein
MTFIALMWSMPGSRPSSLSRMTPAAFARASRARIAGETYDVVTRCLPCARQRSAMATWWMYGEHRHAHVALGHEAVEGVGVGDVKGHGLAAGVAVHEERLARGRRCARRR